MKVLLGQKCEIKMEMLTSPPKKESLKYFMCSNLHFCIYMSW